MSKTAEALETLGRELWEVNESARAIWGRCESFLDHLVFTGTIFPLEADGLTWGRREEWGVDVYARSEFDLVD